MAGVSPPGRRRINRPIRIGGKDHDYALATVGDKQQLFTGGSVLRLRPTLTIASLKPTPTGRDLGNEPASAIAPNPQALLIISCALEGESNPRGDYKIPTGTTIWRTEGDVVTATPVEFEGTNLGTINFRITYNLGGKTAPKVRFVTSSGTNIVSLPMVGDSVTIDAWRWDATVNPSTLPSIIVNASMRWIPFGIQFDPFIYSIPTGVPPIPVPANYQYKPAPGSVRVRLDMGPAPAMGLIAQWVYNGNLGPGEIVGPGLGIELPIPQGASLLRLTNQVPAQSRWVVTWVADIGGA